MDEVSTLLERHIPALRRYARSLLRDRDAADDLVQDCLERAVGRWALRRRDGDLRSWLFAILHNLFIDGVRKRRREGLRVEVDQLGELSSPEAGPDAGAGLRDVLAAVQALPEDQRAVLLLVGVEELSYEAAARVLGIPIGTVMSRLSRGRERLRRSLETAPPPVLRRVK